jgi:hypothetical protein
VVGRKIISATGVFDVWIVDNRDNHEYPQRLRGGGGHQPAHCH